MEKTPEYFMAEALLEAEKGQALGEVPVGAVLEKDGQILGRGYNLTETQRDPTAHAEIIAIKAAAKALKNQRLTGCNLYVTVEPCPMCAGAIVLARIERLFIGTMDIKTGACGSLYSIPQDSRLNHKVEIETGILKIECEAIMKEFFKDLRKQKDKKTNKFSKEKKEKQES